MENQVENGMGTGELLGTYVYIYIHTHTYIYIFIHV